MNTVQRAALNWIEQGFSVIPIQYRRKEPNARALKQGIGTDHWEPLQKRQPTLWEVQCMFPTSLYNLAVVTGFGGLVVIDFDDRTTFFEWYGRYQLETFMVMTARGVHVYLISEQHTAGRKGKGLDIKAAGGYVLAPPSVHPSGAEYTVLWDLPIMRVRSIDPYLPAELFPVEPVKPVQVHQVNVPVMPADDPWQAAMSGPQPGMDLITAIRQRVSLLDYLPEAEQTRGDGRWWVVRCPFHDDHNPSMWIDAQRGICGCYAGCNGGRPFDVINLWGALRGVDNRTAIFELSKLL